MRDYGVWVRAHPVAFLLLTVGWAIFYWKAFTFEAAMGAVLVSALAAATTVTAPWGIGAIVRFCSSLWPPRKVSPWLIVVAAIWTVLFVLVAELVSDLRSMPHLPH